MSYHKITVYRSSPYVVESDPSSADKTNIVVSFDELKLWIKSGKFVKHLFRYDESLMVTFDLKLIAKPFVTALLIRSLARKTSEMRDDKGAVQKITFGLIC